MSIPIIELPIAILGHLFNRLYCLISIVMTALIAYFNYELILNKLNSKLKSKVTLTEKTATNVMYAFALFNLLLLFMLLLITQTMKKLIARKRPVSRDEV
jgi:heme O synthase-like polyprenyltransferase